MAYLTYTQDPIGSFVEKEVGNTFEFSWNKDELEGQAFWGYGNFPHKVWVASGQIGGDSGYRYAEVKKTVVYIAVDEDEYGKPVIEKWQIKQSQLIADATANAANEIETFAEMGV